VASEISPRDRLLSAAGALFYARGVNAVGVDAICAAAGVSKRTLYQQFGSKDHLVVTCLDTFGPGIVDRYTAGRAGTPLERITAVFTGLWQSVEGEGFRGCAFINATTDLADPAHPARAVARAYKEQLRESFAAAAREGGARDPGQLAEQLLMLFDGAMVTALMGTVTSPDSTLDAVLALTGRAGLH
jgi:AcrR family transcriptional regulator